MVDQTHSSSTSNSGGNTGLAFIVGGLVVIVAVLGYFVFVGAQQSDDITISIDGGGSAMQEAGEAIEDAVGQ